MRTLLKNAIIITKDAQDNVLSPGWLLIDNDSITDIACGTPTSLTEEESDKIIDANGNIVMPGLINCHTHFAQTLLKGSSESLTLEKWLTTVIRPLQENISVDQMNIATQLTAAENIRHGITTVVQHHKVMTSEEHVSIVLASMQEIGLRMALMIGCNDKIVLPHGIPHFVEYVERTTDIWKNDQFIIGFGPTSMRNLSIKLLQAISKVSQKSGIPIHIHIAETENERSESLAKRGLPPVKWLDSIGILNELVQLVHCVWVDDEELDAIKASGAYVIHCPISNMYLGSGLARIAKMLSMNIPVVIGSDGSASSISQDILGNLRIASLLLKVSSLGTHFSSSSCALYMVTKWAARMLGREDIGQLIKGAKADLIMIETANVRLQPINDPQVTVLFNTLSSDISMVMVGGKILLDKGELTNIDETNLITEAKHFHSKFQTLN